MKAKQRMAIAILLVAAAAAITAGVAQRGASAQEGGGAKERRVKLMEGGGEGERANTEVAAAFFGLGAETTTGAPFSAQVLIESTQTLANGSHIVDKQTGAVYRDSEGRLRRELPRSGEPEIVVISDPVASVNYRLHMFQQTVVKYRLETVTSGSGEQRKVKEMAEHRAAEEREMKARANKAAGGSSRVEPIKKAEEIGVQTIEGLQAFGKRLTITVPSGMAGNDQPFDIVSETWYSPQLKTPLMVRRNDPRSGEKVYRLTGISLSEPAHSLFEVPQGFTVIDEKK